MDTAWPLHISHTGAKLTATFGCLHGTYGGRNQKHQTYSENDYVTNSQTKCSRQD